MRSLIDAVGFEKASISIATAPTNHLPDWSGLRENARGQEGANNPDDPVRTRIFCGTSDNRITKHLALSRPGTCLRKKIWGCSCQCALCSLTQ